MSLSIARLGQLGLSLPTPSSALANYLPFLLIDGWIYVSGQLPIRDGLLAVKGLVGVNLSVTQGYEAARLCALGALGQLAQACGNLDRVRLVRVGGFVASGPDFFDQSKVVDGASDLFVAVLGENGRHARVAIGVHALPRDAAVEVEVVARIVATDKLAV